VSMTTEAKSALSKTIRCLRGRLLGDLHDSTEAAYRLSVRPQDAGLSEAARAKRKRLDAWLDEQVRGEPGNAKTLRTRADFRREVEKHVDGFAPRGGAGDRHPR
jgi:hypothetical protein